MVEFNRNDLEFILAQIEIAEQHASGTPLSQLVPNPLLPWGLRTVDGTFNNIIPGRDTWGSADQPFPELVDRIFGEGTAPTVPFTPGPSAPPITNTDYSLPASVVDTAPRTISNLIADQTLKNPAAILAALKFSGIEGENASIALAKIQQAFAAVGDPAEALARAQAKLEQAKADLALAEAAQGSASVIHPFHQITASAYAAAIPQLAAAQLQLASALSQLTALQAELGVTGTTITAAHVAAMGNLITTATDARIAAIAARDALNPPGVDFVIPSDLADAQALVTATAQLFNAATTLSTNNPLGTVTVAGDVTRFSNTVARATEADGQATSLGEQLAVSNTVAVENASAATAAAEAVALAQQAVTAAEAEVANPDAAVQAAQAILDGILADYSVETTANGSLVIPNVAPDEGISAPFNSWMTLFGQFFDHGLDLVAKTSTSKVYIPLQPDDPLYVEGGTQNFMVVTRTTTDAPNLTTPLVDQNQTYTSHASHQVFLREYSRDGSTTRTTGQLLEGDAGGLATWADIKTQAIQMLGIDLDDRHIHDVPLVAADPYGAFVRAPNGYAMVAVSVTLSNGTTVENVHASGKDGGLDLLNITDADLVGFVPPDGTTIVSITAHGTGHAFLDDIAHTAAPAFVDPDRNPATDNSVWTTPDDDATVGDGFTGQTVNEFGVRLTYDDELLDRHFITGDGRGNENIGLTAVHHVFHSEHNRLAEHTKDVVIASADLAFVNSWLGTPIDQPTLDGILALAGQAQADAIDALAWNGERLFQAARFGTEMQYQHLVFEEFARKVNPMVDLFVFNPTMDINPVIFAEFAHTVYRFGHSMLNETVARLGADGADSDDIGLIAAFLNPVEFNDLNGATVSADVAAGAIVRGMTRQRGNEIDEFVTEALRNNLLGLPLDLATINLARGREAGVPTLQEARASFYAEARSEWVKPYTNWIDFAQHLKNPASIVNFIAAYGNHEAILAATTLDDKRKAATAIILGDNDGTPDTVMIGGIDIDISNREEFLNGSSGHAALGGLDLVDFWIGGLAESILPFGGMLGSSFTFVFEKQLENLQNGDRFYYLSRTQGLHFLQELENNAFSKVIMSNTDLGTDGATHLPGEIFSTPDFILEVNTAVQSVADPVHDDPILQALEPKVARDLHLVVDGNTYAHSLKFTGGEHVVLGGTEENDVLIADLGDDTIWGDGGDDYIEGGHGINRLHGGTGDDIIYGGGDPEFIHGDEGNDVINAGNGLGDLVFPGQGNDFVISGIDGKEVFGAEGSDFILGSPDVDILLGGEGDDWIEGGEGFDTLAGDNSQLFFNSNIIGHDVLFSGTNENDFDAESGDDIMVQGESVMRNEGMFGFDWVSFEEHTSFGADADMRIKIFTTVQADILRNRFDRVEAMSGSAFNDIMIGDDRILGVIDPLEPAAVLPENLFTDDELTREGVARINGLDQVLGRYMNEQPDTAPTAIVYQHGNILLGGDGNDMITGGGGDDIIDGDKSLNARIGINGLVGGQLVEIGTAEKMQGDVHFYTADEVVALNAAAEVSGIATRYGVANAALVAREGQPLDGFMFDRSLNPSQLSIVREILNHTTDNDPASATYNGDFDTASFQGSASEYSFFAVNGDGTRGQQLNVSELAGRGNLPLIVEHTFGILNGGGVLVDGTDTLTNVERLQFADGGINLVAGINEAPVGTAAILAPLALNGPGATSLSPIFQAGVPLKVAVNADGSLAGVTDPDNANGGVITNFTVKWQIETGPATGIFVDALATGLTYTPPGDQLAGINGERVRAVISYTDGAGIPESVTTPPTQPLEPATFLTQDTDPALLDDVLAGTHNIPNIPANQGFGLTFPHDGNDGTFAAPVNGGLGDDELHGLSGDDVLDGGAGSDIIDGGFGTDTAVFEGTISDYTIARTPTGTIEIVHNANLSEDEIIDIEFVRFVDGASVVTFTIQQIADFADGIVPIPNLVATTGDDIIVDIANNALTIDALAGDDQVFGLDLGDTLDGNVGADTLNGGDGDDRLIGGAGSDIIIGGAGADTAVMDVALADATFALTPSGSLEVVGAVDEDELIDIETVEFAGGVTRTIRQAENLIPDFQRGTAGGETLDATGAVNDTIRGLGGADTINGLGGDDLLLGDAGADTLNGGAGNDQLAGGLGADTVNGGANDDTIFWFNGDGLDVVNGGADIDTLSLNGDDAVAEVFTIFTRAEAEAAGLNAGALTNEIVVTRSLAGDAITNAHRIALVRNIEELEINARPITGNGLARGDTVNVVGDFTTTSLALNTITVNGSEGNDTIDITNLLSAHRIVFKSNGGDDRLVGDLRPQDVIELPADAGTTVETDNADGTKTISFGTSSVTFSSASSPIVSGGTPATSHDLVFTQHDVTELLKLVRGQQSDVLGEAGATGIRDLEGTGNNTANPDWGSADQPFIRLTEARYGEYDPATGNRAINPIFDGLDPRTISNILGHQEADLAKSDAGANIFFMAFGQYFDHGLDFLPKGGVGTVAIGSGADNPVDLTRGAIANAGEVANGATPQHINKTSPFVDQNQAYGSTELVGQFLREGDGKGNLTARLLSGGPDPSNPEFNLLPSLREAILHHWENNTLFISDTLPGGQVRFRDYFTTDDGVKLVDNGVINEMMAHGLNQNFMGTGHTLIGDANNFIDILDHYVAGDLRANENYTLTSIHTIWARNHNYHVEKLAEAGFTGTAEELFQAAKIVNETEYQKVVFNEFADYLLGGLKGSGHHGHDEYNPNVDARISHEFAAAVYRVGHSLIGQNITVLDSDGNPTSVPLFDAFLNPTNDAESFRVDMDHNPATTSDVLTGQDAVDFLADGPYNYSPQQGYEQIGVNKIIGGIVGQQAEEVDFNLVDAVRNDLVRIRADLFAFNVARGWDVGLGTLNQVRADLLASIDPYVQEAIELSGENLMPYSSWEDFQQRNGLSDAVIAQFKLAYPDLVLGSAEDIAAFQAVNPDIELVGGNTVKGIDRVDLWVGGLAETHINGGMVGSTFWVVLHEQFDRLQEGDRFYYLDRGEGFDFYSVSEEQTFADIVARNTGLTGLDSDIFAAAPLDAGSGGGDTAGNQDDQTTQDDGEPGGSGTGGTEVVVDTGNGSGGTTTAAIIAQGDAGENALFGREADDMLDGGLGDDTIVASAGNDTAVGGGGSDVIDAGTGNDLVFGNSGDDVLTAGAGDDSVLGGSGRDRMSGGDGNDVLDGGADRDVVDAGSGDDLIIASLGDGDDAYHGGAGIDTLDMEAITANITANLGAGGYVQSSESGFDTIDGIENFTGGSGHDRIVAGGAVNVVSGGAGNDTFVFETASRANGDTIVGFTAGDKIDLNGMAQSLGFDQGFTLSTTLTAAGQIQFRVDGGDTYLEGRVDNDNSVDFSIKIAGRSDLSDQDLV